MHEVGIQAIVLALCGETHHREGIKNVALLLFSWSAGALSVRTESPKAQNRRQGGSGLQAQRPVREAPADDDRLS